MHIIYSLLKEVCNYLTGLLRKETSKFKDGSIPQKERTGIDRIRKTQVRFFIYSSSSAHTNAALTARFQPFSLLARSSSAIAGSNTRPSLQLLRISS